LGLRFRGRFRGPFWAQKGSSGDPPGPPLASSRGSLHVFGLWRGPGQLGVQEPFWPKGSKRVFLGYPLFEGLGVISNVFGLKRASKGVQKGSFRGPKGPQTPGSGPQTPEIARFSPFWTPFGPLLRGPGQVLYQYTPLLALNRANTGPYLAGMGPKGVQKGSKRG